MARTVPGSGAVIEPIFDEVFGVRAVNLKEGGSGYDPADPPRLTIDGCGTPDREAILYPIIDEDSGRIIHVRVLDRGRGYDPLRLQIIPEQETPNIVDSFDFKRIWQSHPNSPTTATFQTFQGKLNDRLRIVSDNHPKPNPTQAERVPGGGPLVDRSFDQIFIYRGGKDVPYVGDRVKQTNKNIGILANGSLLHTPNWEYVPDSPINFNIDTVKYPYVKDANQYHAVTSNNNYFYQSHKFINEFALDNGVFDWGEFEQFTWNVKTETDNVMLVVTNVDEEIATIQVGDRIDQVGGNGVGTVAKIVRSNGVVTRLYIREVINGNTFEEGDLILGGTGFSFNVASGNNSVVAFPNGIFYIDFGPDASEFGPFLNGQYYFAPENIRVQRNYLIIWNQSDASNQPEGALGHPMQFSITADGALNGGTLYYNSTGASDAPAADYENEFQPLFIMNPDESNRVYYHCKHHRYMSGYAGDEGYMILDPTIEEEEEERDNTYYAEDYYQSDPNDEATIDQSRHVDGHSKILGMSFDGYPIYGPWGYNASGTVAREVSSYRLKTTAELDSARPQVNTESTLTYAVTVVDGEYLFAGNRPPFLDLERGRTYVFTQDDASNVGEALLFSTTSDGWHNGGTVGDTSALYDGNGITYYHDEVEVTYNDYITNFATAVQRKVQIKVPVNSPAALYIFAYTTSGLGVRTVQEGYVLGDLIEDYIFDSSVGTLDEFNGKFAVTPEYPNGTYAYFATEDTSGNPVYPYLIGPKFYGTPLFEGDTVPALVDIFPTTATGDVVLNESGGVDYITMKQKGDNYFGTAKAKILGGEGTGATANPVVQTITGLSLLNAGRSYQTPPTLIFEGGGGQGAQGAARIDTLGKVNSVTINDNGEFYQEAPYVLITGGGGIGAKAVAEVTQGEVTSITVTDPGEGYTSPPSVVFTKLTNLKRTTKARQSLNAKINYLTGIVKDIGESDDVIYVDSTNAFPGSGTLYVGTETIKYTAKSEGKFTGLTRGVNFNYDQRIVIDDLLDDVNGISQYKFNVGDRLIRRVDNANNKVAKVYDWNPNNKELLVVFEVDELAFIDAGIPSTEDTTVQFDAGVAGSSGTGVLPHTVITSEGNTITLLTNPISTLADSAFEDDDELEGVGDGIADLINTATTFAGQINLDGGIYSSLYGIEETLGGQTTTLFQVGDSIGDGSIPSFSPSIIEAGGLGDGLEHIALVDIKVDLATGSGGFSVNEIITGSVSGIRGTVVSWNATDGILRVKDIVPFDTGNVNVGVAGLLYEFSSKNTIVDVYIQNPGTNYSATPTVVIENTGDIQATATVNMTTAGDQVASLSITNGGYGIPQTIDGTYNLHPTLTFTNDASDTTGTGVAAYAIMGGEEIVGNGGSRYRIKSVDYQSIARS